MNEFVNYINKEREKTYRNILDLKKKKKKRPGHKTRDCRECEKKREEPEH